MGAYVCVLHLNIEFGLPREYYRGTYALRDERRATGGDTGEATICTRLGSSARPFLSCTRDVLVIDPNLDCSLPREVPKGCILYGKRGVLL